MQELYRDPQAPVEARVEDLLVKMTVAEKVGQMMQVPYSKVTKEEALAWADKGAGSFLHVLGDDARALQARALASRLGIPLLFGIDAIHGHGLNDRATIFPTQLAAACSWNRELITEMGRVTAREVATDGLHWTFSPLLCLARDTRWGRVGETFGEDPFLAGELGHAIIRGYQGDDIAGGESILACAKHYIGYGEAVGGRDSCDTEMTFRKLRDVFLPPFRKAVEAGCATFMTAYGSIDGTPFTISEKALRGILKDELGFTGFIVTDWDNVTSLVTYQRVARDIAEASVLAARAGNDMIMTSLGFYDAAVAAVESGALSVGVIDDAVRRILRMKFLAGLFENCEKKGKPGCFACDAHLAVNKELARQSLVLLENRGGVLPLTDDVRRVAVIGANADDIRAQYGDWSYFTHPEPNPSRTPVRPYYTLLEGIRALAAPRGVQVVYHKGCDVTDASDADLDGAVAAAVACDAIVYVIGDVIEQYGETRDRADLSLSGAQAALFERLRGLNKPIITVLAGSKPLCIETVARETDALVVAFNGGMFGGLAVAELLFGEINPSGKLPISFPRHSGQLPVYYNALPGWHGGKYMDLDATPLYTFGDGLSYTSFAYENLRVDEQSLVVSVDVQNTGAVAGDETVQIYFRDCVSSVMTPEKQLVAFEKVRLEIGERKTVTVALRESDFAIVTPDERSVAEQGDFVIMAGGSAAGSERLQVTCRLFCR